MRNRINGLDLPLSRSIRAGAILKVEGHSRKFFTVPLHFYLVPCLTGGHWAHSRSRKPLWLNYAG